MHLYRSRKIQTPWFTFVALICLVIFTPGMSVAQDALFVADSGFGDDDIYRLNSDGSIDNLTDSVGDDFDFHQATNGGCIVFTSTRNGHRQIFVMDADGNNVKLLSPDDGVGEFNPEISEDGTRIVFVRSEGLLETSLWTMNKDGSEAFPLTDPSPFRYDVPRWSSRTRDFIADCEFTFSGLSPEDSRRRQGAGHTRDIVIWDDDAEGFFLLIPDADVDNFDGAWSPDGARISFTIQDGEKFAIGVVNEDGTEGTLLTSGDTLDSNTSWLDNDTIVFESMRDGNTEIYSIDIDGENETRLTNNAAEDTNPVGPGLDPADLLVAELSGEKELLIPTMLFLSDRNGSVDIFEMNLDGSGQVSRTSLAGDESEPAFFILPPPPGPPVISEGGVVLATLLPTVKTVSPRAIISVFGQNFTTESINFPTVNSQGTLDTILGGTCLMMNGEALPIFAIYPNQINAQASASATFGPASFTVVTDCETESATTSAPVFAEIGTPTPREETSVVEMAPVDVAAPGFFLFPPLTDDGLIAARFNDDAVAVAPAGMFNDQFGPSRPAVPGDVILLYGTGWGDTDGHFAAGELTSGVALLVPGANPSITIGGIAVPPGDVFHFAATPGTAGLYQVAISIPANTPPGNQQVVLTVYGVSSPVGPVLPIAAP